MIAGGALTVRLYDKDVSVTTMAEDITRRVRNLRFTSQLHGGFGRCQFHVPLPYDVAWEWHATWVRWRRIVVHEAGWKSAWEGRIEDTKLLSDGLDITALGYWSSLFDYPHMNGAAPPAVYTYNGDETVEDIIKDVLTNSGDLISSDQTNIADPGVVFAPATDPYTSDDKYPGEIIIEISPTGDNNPWWFAIWDDRVPYFTAQSTATLDWTCKLSDLVYGPEIVKSPTDFASRVYAIYLAGGATTRTNESSDSAIEGDQRRRTYVVPSLGEVVVGVATQRRDTELAWRKYIHPQSRISLRAVRDTNGVQRPLWRVRAGDTIRIVDLVPASGGLTTPVLDQLRTFFIRHADLDLDRGVLTIEPEAASPNLARQLAKAGIA